MSYDIYKRRLNRYGLDYQSRMQHQRERNFSNYLLKSVYRIDFLYNNDLVPGTLEPMKQDPTFTQAYLLVDINLTIPGGTILQLPDKDGVLYPWIVYYLEQMEASGYNRYLVLKLNYFITWKYNNKEYQQYAYFVGPNKKVAKESTIGGAQIIYVEDNYDYHLIVPASTQLEKDVFVLMSIADRELGFRVVNYDIVSTDGIMYAALDPVYKYDTSPAPEQPTEPQDDYYWISGGK